MDSTIEIREADTTHVESLKTILARSFFPVNDIVREALPDNAEMRDWWGEVYAEEVDNPKCRLLIAVDLSTSAVVGVLCLRHIEAGDAFGGFWTKHPWTESHSKPLWKPSVDCMVAYEESVMRGRPHYLLELMAVDHEYKSRAIGRRLVQEACKMADEARLPIFLQSGGAKDYYMRLNMWFRPQAEPEWEGYKACILVRPVAGACWRGVKG